MTDMPEFYFRVRENGAMVFRVDTENRMRRIEMTQIAVANVKNGEIKAHGDHVLSEAEQSEIESWLDQRRAELQARELDNVTRTIERLNLTTVWAQQSATPEDLDRVADRLLLAMHDLRSVLVRKKAQQVEKTDAE